MKNRIILILILILSITASCLGSCYLFIESPYGLCVTPLSGHVPEIARDLFIERVINAAVAKDIEWLLSVSRTEEDVYELVELAPKFGSSYTIHFGDDLGGLYSYTLIFNNGYKMRMGLWGSWPECPDNNITEDEIFNSIKLISVVEVLE